VIFINQIRMKIGVMFGSPETTPGGRALKFHASVRIDIRRIGSIKDGDVFVGNQVRAKVAKNKVAPPFRMAEFEILFNRGISWEGTLLDTAVNMKIVDRAGAWFSYKGTRLGQGREQARGFLEENQDITQEIEGLVRAAHAQSMGLDVETDEDEGESGSETPEETDTKEEAGAGVETGKATKK
jgi:recombination protein RecA